MAKRNAHAVVDLRLTERHVDALAARSTGTPGLWTIIASDVVGTVSLTLHYDPATGNLVDAGSPAACLVVVNNSSIPWPCTITTAAGSFTRSIPVGTTAKFTAAQITSASGISNVSQVQVSL